MFSKSASVLVFAGVLFSSLGVSAASDNELDRQLRIGDGSNGIKPPQTIAADRRGSECNAQKAGKAESWFETQARWFETQRRISDGSPY